MRTRRYFERSQRPLTAREMARLRRIAIVRCVGQDACTGHLIVRVWWPQHATKRRKEHTKIVAEYGDAKRVRPKPSHEKARAQRRRVAGERK